MTAAAQCLQVRRVKGIAALVDWLDVINFQPAGKFAAHAAVTVPDQDATAHPLPLAGRHPPMVARHSRSPADNVQPEPAGAPWRT